MLSPVLPKLMQTANDRKPITPTNIAALIHALDGIPTQRGIAIHPGRKMQANTGMEGIVNNLFRFI